MKSLIATVVLLSTVLLLTVLNFHYVNSTVEELQEMLETLPDVNAPHCVERAKEIEEYWERKQTVIDLTVSYPFIDRIGEQAALLVACASAKDLYGFESARTLLYDATKDLRRAEQFSVKNLF